MKRTRYSDARAPRDSQAYHTLGAAGRRERSAPGQPLPFSGTAPCGTLPRPM